MLIRTVAITTRQIVDSPGSFASCGESL